MDAWPPVTQDDLKAAATSAGFDLVFPVLIRRLIAETAKGLTKLDMPGGSGTSVGGFDGIVEASEETAFVPAGTSVWELSVGGGNTKANEDYSKRDTAPDGLETQDVTYVAALLVRWRDARAWGFEKSKDGRWREVRGYNLDRIDTWLEQAPVTTIWLACRLGKTFPGALSLGSWWENVWLPSTSSPLGPSIVLAGREQAADDLVAVLGSGRPVVTLGGSFSADEVSAFVAAALERADSLDRSGLGARALLVSEEGVLSQLLAQPQRLVLLLTDAAMARALPPRGSHQYIVNAEPGRKPDVTIPRVSSQAIEEELKSANIPHEQAARLGILGRRSLLALRRALAKNPELLTPSWATSPSTARRRTLLLGAWQDADTEDRRIVASFVGQPYEQVVEEASRLDRANEVPFLGLVHGIRYVLAREDAWTLLSTGLTPDDLEPFQTVALEVLAEPDPVLGLATTERWLAGMNGTRRRFSPTLRTGLAETLALMGASTYPTYGTSGNTSTRFARMIVRDLLHTANTDSSNQLWLSLTDVLGLLAEAAPEEFASAMRFGLSGAQPTLAAIFTDQKTDPLSLSPSSPHSSFLWALESLAWSPEHIDDAVDILTALAVIDPGGKLANRPITSLVGVLSAWAPNTAAPTDDRIRCIRRVFKRHPEVGRRLLLDLIPNGHNTQTVHPGPRFRDWKHQPAVTRGDLVRVVDTAVSLLAETLDEAPDLYLKLIEKIDDLPPWHRSAIASGIKDLGQTWTDDRHRAQIFEALREKIAHHREYSDTKWALPEDQVEELQEACEALCPQEPALRHAWLFRSGWPVLGDLKRRDDYEAYEQELLARRAAAVDEILAHGGTAALATLAADTGHPDLIGMALAGQSGAYDEEMLAQLELGVAPACDIAAGYLHRRLRLEGQALRDRLLQMTTEPATQARILLMSGEPVSAWEKLQELPPGVGDHYWRGFSPYGLGNNAEHSNAAARSLLGAGRPSAALQLLLLYARSDNDRNTDAAQIAASGLEALVEKGTKDPELRTLNTHDLEQLFNFLSRHRDEVGRDRLIRLEWHTFPISTFDTEAPTLHSAIVEDPAFFCRLVTLSFKPDSEKDQQEPNAVERSEQERANSARAYEVLESCHRYPGTAPESQLDAGIMRSWVAQSRALLGEAKRTTIGDIQIGRLLARSPTAAESAPLHEAVRDLLEDLQSDNIEHGIEIAILNARGTTTRGTLDGGAQEWELAKSYRKHADNAREWPRTRSILTSLAEWYEDDARRQDAAAERRQQGFG